jgi:hypothetical protein
MFSHKPAFAKAPARQGHKVAKVYIIRVNERKII